MGEVAGHQSNDYSWASAVLVLVTGLVGAIAIRTIVAIACAQFWPSSAQAAKPSPVIADANTWSPAPEKPALQRRSPSCCPNQELGPPHSAGRQLLVVRQRR
jgi:hypothetical protein